jgi:CheY-like chemotaxis protein
MSKKVLFIDDDLVLQEVLGRLLKNKFDVMSASTGQKGIEKARQLKPDVIILDIILPNENGWEIAETLKKDPGTKDIPIVVASGAGSFFEDNPHVEKQLIADYVRKPYDIDELVAAINKIAG